MPLKRGIWQFDALAAVLLAIVMNLWMARIIAVSKLETKIYVKKDVCIKLF